MENLSWKGISILVNGEKVEGVKSLSFSEGTGKKFDPIQVKEFTKYDFLRWSDDMIKYGDGLKKQTSEFKLHISQKTKDLLTSTISYFEDLKQLKCWYKIQTFKKINQVQLSLFERGGLYKVIVSFDIKVKFRYKFYYGSTLLFVSDSLSSYENLKIGWPINSSA